MSFVHSDISDSINTDSYGYKLSLSSGISRLGEGSITEQVSEAKNFEFGGSLGLCTQQEDSDDDLNCFGSSHGLLTQHLPDDDNSEESEDEDENEEEMGITEEVCTIRDQSDRKEDNGSIEKTTSGNGSHDSGSGIASSAGVRAETENDAQKESSLLLQEEKGGKETVRSICNGEDQTTRNYKLSQGGKPGWKDTTAATEKDERDNLKQTEEISTQVFSEESSPTNGTSSNILGKSQRKIESDGFDTISDTDLPQAGFTDEIKSVSSDTNDLGQGEHYSKDETPNEHVLPLDLQQEGIELSDQQSAKVDSSVNREDSNADSCEQSVAKVLDGQCFQEKKDFKLFSVYSGETQSLPSQLNVTYPAKSQDKKMATSGNVFDKKAENDRGPTSHSSEQNEENLLARSRDDEPCFEGTEYNCSTPKFQISKESDSLCKKKELLTNMKSSNGDSELAKKNDISTECSRNGKDIYADSYYNRSTEGFTPFDKDQATENHDANLKLDSLNEAETLEWKEATLSISSHDTQRQNSLLDPTLTADNTFSYASDVVAPAQSTHTDIISTTNPFMEQGHFEEKADSASNAAQRLKKIPSSKPLSMTPHSQDLLDLLHSKSKRSTLVVHSQTLMKKGSDETENANEERCKASSKELGSSTSQAIHPEDNEDSVLPTVIVEGTDKTENTNEERRKASSKEHGSSTSQAIHSEDNEDSALPTVIVEGTDKAETTNEDRRKASSKEHGSSTSPADMGGNDACDTKITDPKEALGKMNIDVEGDSTTEFSRGKDNRNSNATIITRMVQAPRSMHELNDEINDSDDGSTTIASTSSNKKVSSPIKSVVDSVRSPENVNDTSAANHTHKLETSKEDRGKTTSVDHCINEIHEVLTDNSNIPESVDDDPLHDESLTTGEHFVDSDQESSDVDSHKTLSKLCSLIDTQPDEEECSTKSFRRLKRDFKRRRGRDEEHERRKKDSQTEENQVDEDGVLESSQKTIAIRAQMRQLAMVNVNHLAAKLHQNPDYGNAQMQEQILELTGKNSKLASEKKGVEKENNALRKEVQDYRAKLEAKNVLCEEMSKQIARLQPLIDAATRYGNVEDCKTVSKKFNGHNNDINEKLANPFSKKDCAYRDEATPKENPEYHTPERLSVKKKPVPISISTQKRKRQCPHVLGNLTFSELWRILQEKGWKHRIGPEPYGKVYVSPEGNVRKGSKLGIDFFHGNDLWEKAEELGITNNEENNDSLDDTAISDDDIPISALKKSVAWNSPQEAKKKYSIVEPAGAIIDGGVVDLDPCQMRRRRRRTLSPSDTQSRGTPSAASQSRKVSEKLAEPRKQKDAPIEKRPLKQKLDVIRDTPSPPPIKRPNYSQNAMEGAEILLGMVNGEEEKIEKVLPVGSRKAFEYESYVTKEGIEAMIEFRRSRNQKRKKVSETTQPNKKYRPSPKKQGTTKQAELKTKFPSAVYHMSQSPEDNTVKTHRSPKLHSKIPLPLHGMTFFASGADPDLERTVVKLGAIFLRDIGGEILKESNIHKKLMFLSDAQNRRTHKYLLASALGVPMLHFNWITALWHKFETYQRMHSEGVKSIKRPSPFDSILYTAHRLPLGLSLETGLFVMQQARDAKRWIGAAVLKGQNIVVALESIESEKKWLDIIKATGANAFGSSDSSLRRNDCHIDFVVVDSLSLPPHATAIPARVTKALRKVSACNHGDSEPVIADLSWVTQCIVRKSFIDVYSDKRYQVLLGNDKKDETRVTELFSIKVEHGSCKSRYEVGDSIRFGKGNMSVSYGRIIGIEHNKSNQKHIVEVKVLDLHQDVQIMDGGRSAPTVKIDPCDLQGHIIMLNGKSYDDVQTGWAGQSDSVFLQKTAH